MATSLRLARQQIADLKTIAGIDGDSLQRVVDHLRGLKESPLQPKQLRGEISSILPESKEAVDVIMRQMLGLHGLIGQMRLGVDEVFAGLLAGIESADPKWSSEEIAAWKDRESQVRELLSVDAVRIVAKALNLSYEYANLLRTSRIITDVRPVFSFDATAIDGAVISHKLFVRYDSVEGLKTLTMTLDEADVKTLQRECTRALEKVETIVAHLSTGTALRTIIPGRDSDD